MIGGQTKSINRDSLVRQADEDVDDIVSVILVEVADGSTRYHLIVDWF